VEGARYGPDANHFRPERWIEANPEKAAEMTSTVNLVFHYSTWQYIGKSLALMESNKVFVEVCLGATFICMVANRDIALPQIRLQRLSG
jgi:hypothetical protein